jgi:hypothetical protein
MAGPCSITRPTVGVGHGFLERRIAVDGVGDHTGPEVVINGGG